MPKERKQRNTFRANTQNRNAITEMMNQIGRSAADIAHMSKLRRKITYPPGHPGRAGGRLMKRRKPVTHNFEHIPGFTHKMRRAVKIIGTHASVLGNRGMYTRGKGTRKRVVMKGGVLPPSNRTGLQGQPQFNPAVDEVRMQITRVMEQIQAVRERVATSPKAREENRMEEQRLTVRLRRLMDHETELVTRSFDREFEDVPPSSWHSASDYDSFGAGGVMVNKLPKESKLIQNRESRKRKATVLDPPDLKLDKQLRDAIAMMQANSPLDVDNREHVHSALIHMHERKVRHKRPMRLPRIRKLTKPREKGGFVFTSMRNMLVEPQS